MLLLGLSLDSYDCNAVLVNANTHSCVSTMYSLKLMFIFFKHVGYGVYL